MEFPIIYDVNLCFIIVPFRCFKKDILCLALSFEDYKWLLPLEMEFVLFYKRIEWEIISLPLFNCSSFLTY